MMKNHSHISIRTDGRLLITDFWGTLKQPALQTSEPVESRGPIGIVQHGILFGEEVHGKKGCGSVYIHGCALKCRTCYQPEFFTPSAKSYMSPEDLAALILSFQAQGVDAVEIVIAHYQREVHQALKLAKSRGLYLPIVYKFAGQLPNKLIDELCVDVDIFIPDIKGWSQERLALQGLPSGLGESSVRTVQHLLKKDRKVILRFLYLPEFTRHVEEIEEILGMIGSSPYLTFSFLKDYLDPLSGRFYTAPLELQDQIEKRCVDRNIPYWRAS